MPVAERSGAIRGDQGLKLPAAITAIVDGAVDAAAIVDSQLRLLYFNRSFARLAGRRERELSKGDFVAMCHTHFGLDACANAGECVARRALRLDRAVRVDEVRSRDKTLTLVVTAVPLRDEEGRVYGVMEVYRDVTAESRMQTSYRDLLDRERDRNVILQREVQVRTQDLARSLEELRATRTQLVHAEKMSSLGRLVAGIAHELNNPINFIYANIDFAEEYSTTLLSLIDAADTAALPEEVRMDLSRKKEECDLPFLRADLRRIFDAMRAGSERAAAIVQGLRTFSHSQPTSFAMSDVNAQIALALRIVGPHATDRVTLASDLGNLPRVRCDGAQIGQVVTNLVVNAIDAIETKGTVAVRTLVDGEDVVIEVDDDGRGIPAEGIGKLFEPFFTTKEVGEGTGLGLSISFGIVQAHGGTLTVESEPGKGSTFRVRLPILGPPA